MKHIKGFRVFESIHDLNREQIYFLNEYVFGTWNLNPETGLVDVEGDFVCRVKKGLDSFKGIKFGTVTKGFDCSYNSLTSLEGSPKKVGQSFFCSHNSLISLEGSPHEVGKSFDCDHNKLTTLEGAPREVGAYFTCQNNSLTSLEGAPKEVAWSFDCCNNSLVSLKGAPDKVLWSFICDKNPLTSLEGAPQKVVRDFKCDKFKLNESEWNPQGWLKILREGGKEAKKLILTLPYLDPESIQREIEKNPGKWVMTLKGVWNLEEFKPIRDQLKVSDQFLKDIGDQSTLSDLGF